MEQEIDLRPYLQALLRQWRVLLGVALVALVAAAGLTLAQPRISSATATVLIEPVSSQVVLDPRFTERDTAQVTNAVTRRQALIDLAESPVLEARVIAALGSDEFEPGELLQKVTVGASSDLLELSVTDQDPAEAARLAELWGQEYERLVAELYAGSSFGAERIGSEIEAARSRHNEARRVYESFLSEGDLVRAEQEVRRLEGLLGATREAHQRLFTQQLSRTQELELLLIDARSLRAQVASGSTSGAADGLAALALRLRASGASELPVDLSVAPEALVVSREQLLDDLERLAAAIESERDRLMLENARVAAAIAAGDNAAVGVNQPARVQFEAELSTASATLERLRAEQEVLSQTVALSLDTLAVLQAKSDEDAIGQATTNVQVRFLGTGPVAPPSLLTRLVLNSLLATVLAVLLATTGVVLREAMRQRRRDGSVRTTPPADGSPDPTAVPR
jgi:uncharacterized protein involved in exopolysaccharide biosynthesis